MKNDKTIESVVTDGLCTGCGTCFAVCPVSAVNMTKSNRQGTYVPQINWEMCNQCGICFEVCPGHSVDYEQLNRSLFGKEPLDTVLGCYLNCYAGHATDYDIRYNATSGGMVTALLISALGAGIIDGALVTRMSQENPFEPEPFIARTKAEIISAARSKYCPVPANIALRGILKEDGKYAVVGLPCQISGMRKAEELNSSLKAKIVLHLGLFCIQSQNFQAVEFLLWQRGINKEDVSGFQYRGTGWPGGGTIYLKDGRQFFIPLVPDLREVYDVSFFPFRCKLCTDPANEFADICFGDAFLPEFLSKDSLGTSSIVSRTQKGEEFLQSMADRGIIDLYSLPAERIRWAQEDFHLKKSAFKIFRWYTRVMRRKLPEHDTKLSRLRPIDVIESGKHLMAGFLSSKRLLWPLVLPYIRLMRFLAVLAGRMLRFLRLGRVLRSVKGY